MTDAKRNILVVEDSPSIMKAEVYALQEAGYHVDVAVDGSEALELIGTRNYAVILLDLVMPKRTGFDVLNDLKRRKVDIPVLVFSNMDDEVSREEVLSLGAKNYYNKNKIGLDELVKHVEQFIV